jgi:hypothetical protein
MNRGVKVQVKWASDKMKQGLPSSKCYSTVAKFPDDHDWPENSWSIVLEFESPEIAHAKSFEATARFLMPNGPHERLKPGCVFEMYEGVRQTATVTVL